MNPVEPRTRNTHNTLGTSLFDNVDAKQAGKRYDNVAMATAKRTDCNLQSHKSARESINIYRLLPTGACS